MPPEYFVTSPGTSQQVQTDSSKMTWMPHPNGINWSLVDEKGVVQRVWSYKPESVNMMPNWSIPIQPEFQGTGTTMGITSAMEVFQNPQFRTQQGRFAMNQHAQAGT